MSRIMLNAAQDAADVRFAPSELRIEYSTVGMNWDGFALDLWATHRQPISGSYYCEETQFISFLGSSRISWMRDGVKRTLMVRPGMVSFWRRGDLLRGVEQDEIVRSICVRLDNDRITELLQDEYADACNLEQHVIASDPQAVGIISLMCTEAKLGNPGGRLLAQSLSSALAAHAISRYSDETKNAARLGKLSIKQLEKVVQYVASNYRSEITLNELASLVDLSPSHFSKTFSATLGVSPYRYILQTRVELAKRRLCQPRDTLVSALAAEFGFSSHPHFSTTFRRLVGCSPEQYRRNKR